MPATAAQIIAKIGADLSEFKAGMQEAQDQSKKAGEGIGGFFKKSFATALGNLEAQAVNFGLNILDNVISSVVDETSQLSDAESILNQRLLSTHDAVGLSAGAIEQLAQNMSDASGVAEPLILQGDDMLLTFTGIGSTVFPQASQAMEDLAISMNHGQLAGADFQSAAIELGKALNDPLTGMTALQRVGVTFSDQQKQLIKDYMAHGETAKAQGVILKELSKEFGGTAVAAGSTFGGSLDKLKNIVVDFGANALLKLENWVQPWLDAFTKWLPGAMDTAGQYIGKFVGQLGNLFKGGMGGMNFGAIATAFTSTFSSIQQQVLPIAHQLTDWFQSSLLPAIQSVLPDFQEFADVLINDLVPAVISVYGDIEQVVITIDSLLLPIIETLLPIVIKLYGWIEDLSAKALKQLIPWVKQGADQLKDFASQIAERLQPFISNLVQGIQFFAQVIQTEWVLVWPIVSAVVKLAWDNIKSYVQIAWDFISGIFKIFADLLSGNWGQLWADVQDTGKKIWNDIKSWFGGMWNDIGGIWSALWDQIGKVAGAVWAGVSGGVKSGLDDIIGVLNSFIGFLDSIQIHIPAVGVGPVHTPAFDWNGLGIPKIPLLEMGGPVIAGMPYIVGEKRPELFVPNQSGYVHPSVPTAGETHYHFNGITDDHALQRRLTQINQRTQALAFGGRR